MVIHSSFVRNIWISATSRVFFHPFTYPHLWTLLISNSLLSIMTGSLALVPDKARMNDHQASCILGKYSPNFCTPNDTKFGVFQSLCKIINILKLNLSLILFYKTKFRHGKRTWEMPSLTLPVNTAHQKFFEFEWLIILYSYCHAKSVFRWEYLQ